MIDNPENGQVPEMRDLESEPMRDGQTATAVAEPDAETSQAAEMPSEHRPASPNGSSSHEMPEDTVAPVSVPVSTPEAAGDGPVAVAEPLPAATEPVGGADFSSELATFRHRFEEIQAEFIGEPRTAVDKAETLIDGLVNALRAQLQRVHTNVEGETDTEHLRVAMLGYRELIGSLGTPRAT